MKEGPLGETLLKAFDGMSAQLQNAARFILDRPCDVALLSMREQARQAGVQPATMTRLAKHLGLGGFDEIRNMYAEAVRDAGARLPGMAGKQVANRKQKDDHALAAEMLKSVTWHIAQLAKAPSLDRVVSAAASLAKARKIYCLGLRSSHTVAWHFQYLISMVCDKSVSLDCAAGIGGDGLKNSCEEDVLLVVSVHPYTRATFELAYYAKSIGVAVIAITDSEVSPLARIAKTAVVVPTNSPSLFHTMTPAFAIAEVLGFLVAAGGGDKVLEPIERFNKQLAALNTHLKRIRRNQ
ncbi:MurR/RpiR family transcriptional regulator [Mesorhizobium ciceri]|uniref:MurR/RpiR family transcriptional regulator n=1 Tax=Mesorhizobium TaxID=68287 RepID=UPI0007A93A22|nr:MurR/RpiR family transcriptional regulator [Mesorhizobium ciceri]AMY03399.1 SIS domain-containing protein [Mesorhizobium ciceri biovar biserrulae]